MKKNSFKKYRVCILYSRLTFMVDTNCEISSFQKSHLPNAYSPIPINIKENARNIWNFFTT